MKFILTATVQKNLLKKNKYNCLISTAVQLKATRYFTTDHNKAYNLAVV